MGKKIPVILGIMIITIILTTFLFNRDKLNKNDNYIIKNVDFSLVKKLRDNNITESSLKKKNVSFPEIGDYFSDSLVTPDTIHYFRYLDSKFKHSKDFDSHIQAVKNFLLTQMPEDEARKILDVYKNYLKCEIELVEAQKEWELPKNVDDMITTLRKIQEIRREYLGDEIADTLFGAEVKAKEYSVRRAALVADDSMYGQEKELKLKELNESMWGEDADEVNSFTNPYNLYKEKIAIYQKDLEEADSDEDKAAMIDSFRREYFPEEIVKKLTAIDSEIKRRKETESEYNEQKSDIMNNPELSESEKESAVSNLQKDLFGTKKAESVRRIEIMQKELEKRVAERK